MTSEIFDPFNCSYIKPSWHRLIKIVPAPSISRVYGSPLIGGDCCLWLGWNNGKDEGRAHGIVKVNGVRVYLHRYTYMQHTGLELSCGDHVDHLCRVRLCFNPYHCEAVDYLENYNRGDGPKNQFRKAEDYLSDENIVGFNQ